MIEQVVPDVLADDHAEALRLCAEDMADQIDDDIIAELIRQHAGGKGVQDDRH